MCFCVVEVGLFLAVQNAAFSGVVDDMGVTCVAFYGEGAVFGC